MASSKLYGFAQLQAALSNSPFQLETVGDKQITNDEYWIIMDPKGWQHTFMVCYEKGEVHIQGGFVYEHDFNLIRRKVRSLNDKDILNQLSHCAIDIHAT